jgi:hypothetical protein
VARDLAALEPTDAAADLAARRVPGAAVRDLRAEEQVGARGWCARAVLGDGASPAEALIAVDAIRLPDDSRTEDWAARVPWMVPALVRHVVGSAPDALARSVLALRALGEEVAANPGTATDPASAARASAAALAVPRPVPGSGAFAPAPPPVEAVTQPVAAATRQQAPPPPATAPPPDRRLLAAIAASIGVAVLSLVLVFAIIASPGSFGLASTSQVNDRVSVIEAGVGQLRNDVGTLARELQSGGGTPAQAVEQLAQQLDDLRRQVEDLCSVLPVVC